MKKILAYLFLIFALSTAELYAHNESSMSQELYSCPLTEPWNSYEQNEELTGKKMELSQLRKSLLNHGSSTPVTQLKNQQEYITSELLLSINQLEAELSRSTIDSIKCRKLEVKIQELIFFHLEFEKTISDFKSEQMWKMTRIVLLVLSIFIFTTIFMTLTYNSAKRRAKKAREFNNQIIRVQEEERQRLSRELHDTVTQDIRTALLYIRNLKSKLIDGDSEGKDLVQRIENLESQNLINIRNIIRNLTPPEIESADLHNLLVEYCNNITQMTKLKCTFYAEKEINFLNFTSIQKLNIFRIIQEAITNSIKHAEASEINLLVRRESENSHSIIFFISDDGHGFSSAHTASKTEYDLLNQSTHLGLQGMKTRAHLIDAKLEIFSDEECGTEIRFTVTPESK